MRLLLILCVILIIINYIYAIDIEHHDQCCNPNIGKPVCGVDGKTYPNSRCCVVCSKVAIAKKGPCSGSGNINNGGCNCGSRYIPVCGSDGKTYKNQCYAKCADVKVQGAGKCGVGVRMNSRNSRKCKNRAAAKRCEGVYNPCCVYDPLYPDGKLYFNRCEAACDGYSYGISAAEPGQCNGRPCMQCKTVTCGCPSNGIEVCAKIYNGKRRTFPNECLAKCRGHKIIVNRGKCHEDSHEVAARRSVTRTVREALGEATSSTTTTTSSSSRSSRRRSRSRRSVWSRFFGSD